MNMNKKTTWTPGPWKFGVSKSAIPMVWDSRGRVICRLGEGIDDTRDTDENALHNGPLIALAPEMAEVLRAILAKLDNMTSKEFTRGADKPEREQARALLARLEGGK